MSFELEHERQAVIHLENPIRMTKGFEPRYTYYNGNRTINIITGAQSSTAHTVLANDPGKLVTRGSKGAYRK